MKIVHGGQFARVIYSVAEQMFTRSMQKNMKIAAKNTFFESSTHVIQIHNKKKNIKTVE